VRELGCVCRPTTGWTELNVWREMNSPENHSVQPITLRARATISSSIDAYNTPAKTREGVEDEVASRAGQVPPRGDDQGEAHEGESRGDQPRDLHRPCRHAVIQAPITSAGGPGKVTGPEDVPAPREIGSGAPEATT
jgi:hypothetical protein